MSPTPDAPDDHGFVKRPECPPSGALLAYAGESVTGWMREGIEMHLTHCDFCSAELQLLGKHPPLGEVEFVPAPLPLSFLLIAEQRRRGRVDTPAPSPYLPSVLHVVMPMC
jgi:hypothetical protein